MFIRLLLVLRPSRPRSPSPGHAQQPLQQFGRGGKFMGGAGVHDRAVVQHHRLVQDYGLARPESAAH